MTDTLACDVSYYQKVVTDDYQHEWLIFRACDGTFRDPNFSANRAWAEHAAATGKVAGYTIYCVYRPGVDVFSVVKAMVGVPSAHVTVMVDVESWNGSIKGNQSRAITKLVKQFAQWLGSNKRVLAYGNQGDLAALYPRRPRWLRLVVAAYSSLQPTVKNMVGWQYSDGTDRWPLPTGLPRSSKPFGDCDHNIFPGLSPADLAITLGVGNQPKEPHVSVFNIGLLRAVMLGGDYATKEREKRWPRLARPEGVRAQADRIEKDGRQLASQVAKLSAELDSFKKGQKA